MDFPLPPKKLTNSYFPFLPKPHAKRGQVLLLLKGKQTALPHKLCSAGHEHRWSHMKLSLLSQSGGSCLLDKTLFVCQHWEISTELCSISLWWECKGEQRQTAAVMNCVFCSTSHMTSFKTLVLKSKVFPCDKKSRQIRFDNTLF